MLDFLPPEITRNRLEDVILRIKALELGSVTTFLSNCLDPPEIKIVHRTYRFLHDIQALKFRFTSPIPSNSCRFYLEARYSAHDSAVRIEEEHDVLTPLGYYLANFPMDPQCAKLLILGTIFCCLQPALAVAACLTFKDPFEVPFNKEAENEMYKKRHELAENSRSDHWAFYSALREFRQLHPKARWRFCQENFLNYNTLNDLLLLMQEFVNLLYEDRFIKSKDIDDPAVNLYSHDARIFRAIIAGAFYPNIIMQKTR